MKPWDAPIVLVERRGATSVLGAHCTLAPRAFCDSGVTWDPPEPLFSGLLNVESWPQTWPVTCTVRPKLHGCARLHPHLRVLLCPPPRQAPLLPFPHHNCTSFLGLSVQETLGHDHQLLQSSHPRTPRMARRRRTWKLLGFC